MQQGLKVFTIMPRVILNLIFKIQKIHCNLRSSKFKMLEANKIRKWMRITLLKRKIYHMQYKTLKSEIKIKKISHVQYFNNIFLKVFHVKKKKVIDGNKNLQ